MEIPPNGAGGVAINCKFLPGSGYSSSLIEFDRWLASVRGRFELVAFTDRVFPPPFPAHSGGSLTFSITPGAEFFKHRLITTVRLD